mgnify:CR=1 FL=1
MKDIIIEPMRVSDLDEVLEIEQYSFPTPWSRDIYRYDLERNPRARFYCAKSIASGRVLGYIGSWFVEDECHVGTIAVAREHRSKGIAKLLLEHTAAVALSEGITYIILEVRINNIPAINVYKSLGFSQVGVRKRYYSDTGEDALIFVHRDLEALARAIQVGQDCVGGGGLQAKTVT